MGELITHVKCPHCDTVNKVEIPIPPSYYPTVITCDSENGGCDETFAASFALEIKPTLYKLTKVRS